MLIEYLKMIWILNGILVGLVILSALIFMILAVLIIIIKGLGAGISGKE